MSWYGYLRLGFFPNTLKIIHIIVHTYYSHKVVEYAFSPFARLHELVIQQSQTSQKYMGYFFYHWSMQISFLK